MKNQTCFALASVWIFIQNTASESKPAADHNFTRRKFLGRVIEYVNTHDETKIVRRYIHPPTSLCKSLRQTSGLSLKQRRAHLRNRISLQRYSNFLFLSIIIYNISNPICVWEKGCTWILKRKLNKTKRYTYSKNILFISYLPFSILKLAWV